MPEGITVVQATNAKVRIFEVDKTMSNHLIAFFNNDFDRYGLSAGHFEQVGSIGEQVVKRIFRECPAVKNIYIQPDKLTVTVKDVQAWETVEEKVRAVLTDVLYTVHQNY